VTQDLADLALSTFESSNSITYSNFNKGQTKASKPAPARPMRADEVGL
jgi:hypothetical protein